MIYSIYLIMYLTYKNNFLKTHYEKIGCTYNIYESTSLLHCDKLEWCEMENLMRMCLSN